MLVLLPAIFFFVTFVVINRYFNVGRRIASLLSAVLTGTLVTFITETLSLSHVLSFYPLVLTWAFITALSVAAALPVLRSPLKEKKGDFNKFSLDEKFLLFLIGGTLFITGITAVAGTPNTGDSMVYHLSRVEHWIQNKTVSYYPTPILYQLYYCPWGEYALAQARLLCPWGSIVNLLQWFAMAGSVIAVSLITKQLGGTRRAQCVACLTAIMLPMGILQSVSTQNDYVETFWLMCFIFFVLEIRRQFRLLYVFSAGLSLGLALLTKGYGYVLMVPFLILLIGSMLGRSHRLKHIVIIILCVMVLNIGYYARNQLSFGSLTAAKENLITSSFDLKVVAGNLLRNFSVEMDTPSQDFNRSLPLGLAKISGWLGIDFVYDARASMNPVFYQDFRRSEVYSGNFFHMALFTVVFLFFWFLPRCSQGLRLYMVLICSAGLLLCSTIRFQSWGTRFHLPMFIMFCPLFGVFMDRILSPKSIFILAELFLFNALLFLFLNPFHPWFGPANMWQYPKNDQIFNSMPMTSRARIMHDYRDAVEHIKGCHEIGIISDPYFWEYPLWVFMREKQLNNDLRIEQVNVKNISSHIPYPLGDFNPCAVVTAQGHLEIIAVQNKQYRKIWDIQDPDSLITAVYVPVH